MPFTSDFRVRYAETDQMGVVHHAVYYVWFEHLRTEIFRAIGTPYGKLEAEGIFFPVIESGCRYMDGARYDGMVRVAGWLRAPAGVRIRIDYRVEQEGKTLAEGFTIHVKMDADGKPGRIPDDLLEKFGQAASPAAEGPSIGTS